MIVVKREDFIYLPYDVQKFLTHMTVIQNKSELTVNEYASDLRLFFRYLKKQKDSALKTVDFNEINITDIDVNFLNKINYNDILLFLNYCKVERKVSSRTLARKITVLKCFYKFF